MSEEWGYNLVLYLYILATWFSTSHLLAPNQRLRGFSINLMFGVWLVQTAMLGLWFLNMTNLVYYVDALFIFTWVLVTLYVSMSVLGRQLDILLYSMQLIGLVVILTFYLFLGRFSTTIEQLMLSKWIFSHVLIAIAAYATLSISSICAAFYLLSNNLLKQKKWNHLLRRLPSLAELQSLSKRLVRVGLVLLFIAIIQGIILAYPMLGLAVLTDPKIWGSILIGNTYAICLFRWKGVFWCSRRLAWWNLLSIITVIINYFLINSHISFHHWI